MQPQAIRGTNPPIARSYLNVAIERFTYGIPKDRKASSQQEKVINSYVLKNPNSAKFLVFIGFIGALARHPGKTATNCIKGAVDWLIG